MKWENLNTCELEAIDRKIPVILNIAAIEQHGPHLPVSTDAAIGEYWLSELDNRLKNKVLTLPSVKIGCSEHHMDFAGSLTVSHETFLAYVIEIAQSVLNHGFENLIILNSHGGNAAIGKVIAEKLGHRNPNARILFTSWWRIGSEQLKSLCDSGALGIGHACEFETSLMLVIAPEHVKVDNIPKGLHFVRTGKRFDAGLMGGNSVDYIRSMKAISGGNGIVGNASRASHQKGREIIDLVIENLCDLIIELQKI